MKIWAKFKLVNYHKNNEVIWVSKCALAERLESELAKYGVKGTRSDGKDSKAYLKE